MGDSGNNSGQIVLQSDIRHSVGQVVSSVCPGRKNSSVPQTAFCVFHELCLFQGVVTVQEVEQLIQNLQTQMFIYNWL